MNPVVSVRVRVWQHITIDTVKQNGWLLMEVITGSKAYGLDTSTSDTDIRGVFVLPQELYYSMDYLPQVANETNDIVYYELKRFTELLSKNNPNILELLHVPQECVLYRHELMKNFVSDLFLSKLCEQTFANYAFTQIKKAHGLEKKIMQQMEVKRMLVTDFCHVRLPKETIALNSYLTKNGFDQKDIGLSAIPHLRDCYNLYHQPGGSYCGVMKNEIANEVRLSSVDKDEEPIALLYFNRDGYSVYCKKYKEYWDWVGKRNEVRFQNTMNHGKKYDAKNMMHVFRLLRMAKEIALEGKINVRRKDRDFLLNIKAGTYEYNDLIKMAEDLRTELPLLFATSSLPSLPDYELINALLVESRRNHYSAN